MTTVLVIAVTVFLLSTLTVELLEIYRDAVVGSDNLLTLAYTAYYVNLTSKYVLLLMGLVAVLSEWVFHATS